MPKTKSVYILGAGFSCPAKVPVQTQLLKEVFAYTPTFTEAEFSTARNSVEQFITTLFESKDQVTLEDLFTILDRSVVAKERFQNYKWSDLYDIREQLVYAILHIIERRLANISPKTKNIYCTFAKHLIDKRVAARRTNDELAIISSNWDT